MVRVVDCHAGVLGSNPGGPRYFPLGITSMEHAWISLQQRRCLLMSTSAGNVKEICKLLFFPVDN